MDYLRSLADPKHVKRFQVRCGIEIRNDSSWSKKELDTDSDHAYTTSGDISNILPYTGTTQNKQLPIRLTRNGIKNGYSSKLKENSSSLHKMNGLKDINCNGLDSKNKNGYVSQCHSISNDLNSNGHVCNGTLLNGNTHNINGAASSLPKYKVNYVLPYYAAIFGAFLGDEMFYLTFYPFLLWNLDVVLARKTVFVWTLVMFIGQATKDYLKVPRPSSPPVAHLETHHLHEFSLPSTHAMAGTVIPIVIAYLLLDRYEFPFWVAVCCVPVWTLVVCLSRLYLGVHSILDVSAGVIYTLFIVAVTLPMVDGFDHFQQTHPFAPVIVWMIGLTISTVCYPAQGKDVYKGAGIRIVAIYMGFTTGFWMNYHLGLTSLPATPAPYHIMAPSLKWLSLSLLRFLLGSIILIVAKSIAENISVKYLSYRANLDKPDKRHPSVETGYIIFTYSILGNLLIFGIPFIFRHLGIYRSAFYDFL